jgi:hypothetical protein
MPVTICTSWFAVLLTALLYSVFLNSTFADEMDEVGIYGDLTEKQNTTPPPARTRPTIDPRHNQPVPKRPMVNQVPSTQMLERRSVDLSRTVSAPRITARQGYSRALRRMIKRNNKKGQRVGNIKLYAKKKRWGAAVKIQGCYGDNILSKFSITDTGGIRQREKDKISFQFKDVTYRNRGRRRHKWVRVKPGTLIRGRFIYLRARSSSGQGVLTLKVRGNCIE